MNEIESFAGQHDCNIAAWEGSAAVVLGSLGLLDCLKGGAATGPKRAAWVPWGCELQETEAMQLKAVVECMRLKRRCALT